MDGKLFVQRFFDLKNELFGSQGRHQIPVELMPLIREALEDPERRDDMVLQLLTLFAYGNADQLRAEQFINGRLLYQNFSGTIVVFGHEVYQTADDFRAICLCLVEGKPCWIEQSHKHDQDMVVFQGKRGKAYPYDSISRLMDCGGEPCYIVRPRGKQKVSVVWEEEG